LGSIQDTLALFDVILVTVRFVGLSGNTAEKECSKDLHLKVWRTVVTKEFCVLANIINIRFTALRKMKGKLFKFEKNTVHKNNFKTTILWKQRDLKSKVTLTRSGLFFQKYNEGF
jgi:hypothetical protein